ncbi:signal peptidase I [Halalkalibacter krulwichiae]|uniref:Signal peptidase I n=1 Tax=Halalkalibacter krulwichiae TaxID=199441 RepID=A0A1X9M8U2_9BACI|nr:signal peptidase I [Halalkalibacter krulwichiae]ARK29104.1 Signal peptidase IB [Halalkalibacter krulwichiae]
MKENSKVVWWEWVKIFLIAFTFATVIRMFLFTSYEVQGESMMPNVFDGERFIVNKIGYEFKEPERFDLVVFHANEQDDYIKRVIGLPGDTVYYKDDILYINNEAIDEPFLQEKIEEYKWGPYTPNFAFPMTIPEGFVFVLGDNRQNSLDSRRFGPISYEQIVGKVDLRFWPLNEAGVIQ